MEKGRKIIIALGGASGSIYARLLAERLEAVAKQEPDFFETIALITSTQGLEVAAFEDSLEWVESLIFTRYDNDNFFAAPASGSADFDTMIVVPASVGFLGRLSAGVADTLMLRATDVMLKERGRLILVPRETPLSTIHLENMARLDRAGAIICPASPSFYAAPATIDELCQSVVDRILKLANIPSERYAWGCDKNK